MQKALAGTSKGLVVFELEENECRISAIHFSGFNVSLVHQDKRTGKWWVGLSHRHWGEKLHVSNDEGKSWRAVETPSYDDAVLPDGSKARLKQLWCMASGGEDQPEVLWLGTEPGGLFKSEDGGEHFELVKSLWEHPSRSKPEQWFGAGKDHPFIHSILVDPANSDHVYIAVSSAGIFETKDGGDSWMPCNNGLKAAYLPNPHVEIGHDPHHVLMYDKDPQIMWQQNHCGIYYTKNGGKEWHDVSVHDGLPYYGFALAIDQENPACAWVIPVKSDESRIAPDLKLQVYATNDFGKTWTASQQGLPDYPAFDIVLRQAFAKIGDTLLFGTTNGNVFVSFNRGKEWSEVCTTLTKVNAIIFTGQ